MLEIYLHLKTAIPNAFLVGGYVFSFVEIAL